MSKSKNPSQVERGYTRVSQGNPDKPATHKQEPDRLPMITSPTTTGNRITTNYPHADSANKERKSSGGEIKAQRLRGYVLNEKDIGISSLDNGNARKGSAPTIHPV